MSQNIFINSGIRGKTEHNLINPEYMWALGFALGCYITKQYQEANILIGYDTRPSGLWIKENLVQGLLKQKINIYDAGIVPTPFIAKAIRDFDHTKFHLGIVITASHNPAEYNGIKIITPHGYLEIEEEIKISDIFYKTLQSKIYKQSQNQGFIETINIVPFYIQQLEKYLTSSPYSTLKVLLDCAHGATYTLAESIFKHFGVTTVSINNSSNGMLINKNSGCSNPELLIKTIKQYHLEWGCAFDGDGDRIIIGHESGKIFDGDDILIVLAQHPFFAQDTLFVGTIMNNIGIEHYLTNQQKTLIRTPVGEKHIIKALQQHNAHIGSEPCGHITITNHAFCSDGIFAALLFFDTLHTQQTVNLNAYKKYFQAQTTIQLQDKTVSQELLQNIIDGNKILIEPGRAIIRKSNTEPILRIMVEHEDESIAQQLLQILQFLCRQVI